VSPQVQYNSTVATCILVYVDISVLGRQKDYFSSLYNRQGGSAIFGSIFLRPFNFRERHPAACGGNGVWGE
jgi:hypothetical protein